jgi:hypothetical protein
VLAEGQAAEALAGIQQGVVSGTLPADQAAERLVAVIRDAACGVFGVVQPQRSPATGRRPNPWFKHCTAEWRLIKAAIARGDTAAADAYRKQFNVVTHSLQQSTKQSASHLFFAVNVCRPCHEEHVSTI